VHVEHIYSFFVYKYLYGVLNNIQRINIQFPHHSKHIIFPLQKSVEVFRENTDVIVKNIRNINTLCGRNVEFLVLKCVVCVITIRL
jgi:hypothetical protein